MTTSRSKFRPRISFRSGHTLVELVVAMTSASLLMVGMGGTVYIASLALHDEDSNPVQQVKDRQLLEQLMDDVRFARSFSERSNTAVTFTVPDRDDDGVPETIRYAWSGTPGHPLTYTRNGNTTVIAQDVQEFSLTAVTRFMAAPVIPPAEGGGYLLFVSGQYADGDGGLGTPTAAEQDRIDLMEGWGYTVTVISQQATQTEFNAALASVDVVYVSGVCNPSTVGSKVTSTTVGVVTESLYHADELGFYNSVAPQLLSKNAIGIINTTHYITSGFAIGDLIVASSSQQMKWTFTTPSAGATALADVDEGLPLPVMLVLDAGDQLAGGGNAAGRRVQLPWGEGGFDATALNTDGQTIMQRSIEWAAGAGNSGGGPLLFVVTDAAGPSTQETARQTLMESWGYTVTRISDDATTQELAAAMAANDVVYISQEITTLTVVAKLRDANIGVVNEEGQLIDDFGLASGNPTAITLTDGSITDNTHYITSSFALADLALSDPWQPFTYVNTGVAPGVDVIATVWNKPSLMVADRGAELLGGTTAAGRRVQLPWGSSGFDFNALNADAKTIMQRAIEWAAGAGDSGDGPLLFVVADPGNLNIKESGRKTLFESWGYTVTLIDDADTQASFDTAAAANDVIFVSGTINGGSLLDKLTGTTTPVVNEFYGKIDNFGFSSYTTSTFSDDTFTKSDAVHYISSPFSGGEINVLTTWLPMRILPIGLGTLAPGLQSAAGFTNSHAVATLDTGATRWDGNPAPARRVHLPFAPAEISQMTVDAQTLMKRAIEWAAGDEGGGDPGGDTEIYVNDIAMGWRKQGQNYYGQATVWIKDDTGADVIGATVHIQWSGDVTGSAQGVTGSDGKIMLESPSKRNGGTFICTVTDVVESGSTYNSGLNVESSDSITAP